MKLFRKIQILSLLAIFCVMSVMQSYHHHDTIITETEICPIDGVSFEDHSLTHTVVKFLNDDTRDNCAICHFNITKVLLTNIDIHLSDIERKISTFFQHQNPCRILLQGNISLRAPPIVKITF